MADVSQAFYDKLSGDATLQGLLSTFNSAAAVFTTDPVPESAVLPFIVTAGAVSQVPFDTKTKDGREILRDIRCYTDATGSVAAVETIAERVRTLFHRQTLTVTGFQFLIADVSGPIQADDPDAYGRILTVRLVLQNT